MMKAYGRETMRKLQPHLPATTEAVRPVPITWWSQLL